MIMEFRKPKKGTVILIAAIILLLTATGIITSNITGKVFGYGHKNT